MAQLFETEPAATKAVAYAQVALEQGIDTAPTGLTYAVPAALADLKPGERVRVPLGRGNKPTNGFVVELHDTSALPSVKNIKPIIERDRHGVSLTPELISLAKWIASYYCCPLGMVFATMLPAAVKKGTGSVTRTMVGLAAAPEGRPTKLSKLQQAILDTATTRAAADHPWTEIKELADLAGARSVSPVKQLLDKGLLTTHREEEVRSDLDLRAQRAVGELDPLVLNAAQQTALDHLINHLDEGFGVHLLHGVTGSGKTEVYLRAIERVMANAHANGSDHPPSAIVLVPEIALTPQTVGRFLERFEQTNVAVLHSGLTAAQRHAQWRRIRRGEANIVIGARSAIFAPLSNLRLIIVDEEHESSYKQDQAPRYHGRDVAIKRAHLAGIPVVLGSATPSLEMYYKVSGSEFRVSSSGEATSHDTTQNSKLETRNYHLIRLPDRAPGMKMPQVEIIDLSDERRKRYEITGKAGVHLLSLALERALTQTLKDSGQTMLLLNRRGFANYIACPDQRCGWLMRCHYCDVTMVYHKDERLPTGGVVRCHHCEAEQTLPSTCPDCKKNITTFGLGTQRVEEELARKFPDARVTRMDADSMRHGRDYQQCLDAFRAGEIDILVGTQMIAKGLDFPNVRLVGVINADTALNLPDFRAAERTFQLIAQVAGRAGRSDKPGRVLVQTFSPHDPSIQLAAKHDFESFAERELQQRAAVGLPPIGRMARIVVRDKDHYACAERAQTLATQMQQFNADAGGQVRLRGPMPCPIARIADYHRQQIEMLAASAGPLQTLLTATRNSGLLRADQHVAVDVDPVALL
ncbi:primosomal protein N' [Phycisphaerales bacterium AB-hyl4]|uniref:Replication restart protein PriA n=1 Tax=Natronomicrosphaera hydrolytica TaxID=3242702 RepID=A0ABV4U466_9BACT